MSRQKGKYRTEGGGKQDYETDPDFFKVCEKEFNCKLDIASSYYNKKCERHITKEQNALKVNWLELVNIGESVWDNPPYGRDEDNKSLVPQFLERHWYYSQIHGIQSVVLIHTCTDTVYWREWIFNKAAEIRHIQGRLPFWSQVPDKKGNYGNTSDLPHSLIIYRPFFTGETHQISWDWKAQYRKWFGPLPIRDRKDINKVIKKYEKWPSSTES